MDRFCADQTLLHSCPYQIGESSSCPYGRQDADQRECQIVAVTRPDGWSPASAFDMPKDGRVVEVIRPKTSADRAQTLIEHYNLLSLREGGSTWAGIPPQPTEPGLKTDLMAIA